MAGEEKNKASRSWISIAINCIKNQLQEIKDPSKCKEEKEFWGPVSMTLGVIASTNVNANAFINLIIGIVLFLIGFLISITLKNPKPWLRVAITAGFTVFTFGSRVSCSVATISGLILFLFGLISWYIWNKKQRQRSVQEGQSPSS